jgi:iron(III) transport system substrate-binding protein
VAAFATTAIPLNLIAQGAPLKIVIPKPSQGIRYGAGVVAWSKRPNAALVLMDYLMSVRGQTVINGKGESASPLEGIPGSLDASSIQPFDPSKYPPDVVQAESERLDQLFKN